MRRFVITLLGILGFALGTLLTAFHLLAPARAPAEVQPQPALTARLARHLLFVVVDGLRYDIATNAELMPHFARAMQTRTSAEIWAGQVSMTSSAILAFGTAQPGRLEQVVLNLDPTPPSFNSWLENAHRAGLKVVTVGDPSWVKMYGAALTESRVDPEGAAIDLDFNAQTFRDTRSLLARSPDVMVAHFVTPDHQGHAYGIHSARYVEHIKNYDALLHELLSELAADWTVVVTSDHGAADSGTHGTDVVVQRRCPIYAYGPGIASRSAPRRFEQLDLAPTLASLLGVSTPAHGRGHVMSAWLDLPATERARVACQHARGVLAYARASNAASAVQVDAALADCSRVGGTADPEAESARFEGFVRQLDVAIAQTAGLSSRRGELAVLALLVALGVLARLLLGTAAGAGPLLGASVVFGGALYLVYSVERLPGGVIDVVRGGLFVSANLPLLVALLSPSTLLRQLGRMGVYAVLVVPGLLIVSYTANTQAESLAVAITLSLVFARFGLPSVDSKTLLRAGATRLGKWAWLPLLLLWLALIPAGIVKNDICPAWLRQNGLDTLLLTSAALLAWQGLELRTEPRAWRRVAALSGALLLALWARPWAPALLGRSAIVVAGVLAVGAALRGRQQLALGFGLIGFVWLARPFEVLVALATFAVARLFSVSVRREAAAPLSLAQQLLIAVFAFSLLYLQRVGIQNGLEFGTLDLQAGAFGDPAVPAWIVVASLVWKFLLIEAVSLGLLFTAFSPDSRRELGRAMVAVFLVRSAALLGQLFFCGNSYWTAFRVVADLPFALLGLLGAAGYYATLLWRQRESEQLASRTQTTTLQGVAVS